MDCSCCVDCGDCGDGCCLSFGDSLCCEPAASTTGFPADITAVNTTTTTTDTNVNIININNNNNIGIVGTISDQPGAYIMNPRLQQQHRYHQQIYQHPYHPHHYSPPPSMLMVNSNQNHQEQNRTLCARLPPRVKFALAWLFIVTVIAAVWERPMYRVLFM